MKTRRGWRHSQRRAVALGTVLAAAATVTGSAGGAHEPLAEPRGATSANLTLRLDVSTTHPRRGQRFEYVATVRNRGDEPAEAVELHFIAEFAPQDLQGRQSFPKIVSVTGAACTRDSPDFFSLSCPLGTLAAGREVVVRLVVVGAAPASCASRDKAATGARSCKLTLAATLREQSVRAVRTVSFTPAPPPQPLACNYPTVSWLPPPRACYAVQIRASEQDGYTVRSDLRTLFGCPGAPVVEARLFQRIEVVSEVRAVQVHGDFPVLLTGNKRGFWIIPNAQDLQGGALPFRARVTVVREASGALLDESPDRETACAGGPVTVRELENGDCGRRVLNSFVDLAWNGPGQFKVDVDGRLRPYRHCELSGEAGGAEPIGWEWIYQPIAPGRHRDWRAVARQRLYGTRVGGRFTLRGGYSSGGTSLKRVSVVLSFRRVS